MFETSHSKREYSIINKYGYMGKYQFGTGTLKDLERRKLLPRGSHRKSVFLNNPKLQEQAMDALIKANYNLMFGRLGLREYVGKEIGGFTITAEGMLAGAHLGGAGAVKKFLLTAGATDAQDQFKTPISRYMEAFAI
jgi:hypothetical protein